MDEFLYDTSGSKYPYFIRRRIPTGRPLRKEDRDMTRNQFGETHGESRSLCSKREMESRDCAHPEDTSPKEERIKVEQNVSGLVYRGGDCKNPDLRSYVYLCVRYLS